MAELAPASIYRANSSNSTFIDTPWGCNVHDPCSQRAAWAMRQPAAVEKPTFTISVLHVASLYAVEDARLDRLTT